MKKILGCTALVAALITSALASPTASAAISFDQLTLRIIPVNGGTTSTATLLCEPTGGDHPDAAAACQDLIAAGGNIAAIPPQSGVGCSAVFIPVNAQATGIWRGRWIQYSMQFSNRCFARVQTGGHVFHF